MHRFLYQNGTPFGNKFPSRRINWQNTLDFSNLRPGFVLDDSFRTVTFYPGDDSCEYSDTVVTGQLQGSTLQVSVAPRECDYQDLSYYTHKYILAVFGVMLTVTGPQGDQLNPWPDNIQ
jgi:hypothetical protein